MSIASPPLTPSTVLGEAHSALASGDGVRAAELFAAVVEAEPTHFESRYWLYSALFAAGQFEAAAAALDQARNLHSVAVLRDAGMDMERIRHDRVYCAEAGRQLYASNMMGPAGFCLGHALDLDRPEPQLMLTYGLSLQHQGRTDEAAQVFSAAAEVFRSSELHQFLVCARFFDADRVTRVSQEARRWADLYAAPLAARRLRFGNPRTLNRRLRIGYFTPSFTRSQSAQFIVPVLEAHDPAAFEVFAYCADAAAEDPLPRHCKLRSVGRVCDMELVAQMRLDRLDVLVDLWGHSAGSRLTAFARRPAPVQISWVNSNHTTGLACMDYVLHGDCMLTPGAARHFTEEVWSMGEIMSPYRPPSNRPDLVPTPALRNGYVTYGAFINPNKLNAATIAAWASILRVRPVDRLVLKYSYFADPVLQRVTYARFAAYGVQPEQLEFRGHSSGEDYLREFQDIDLALDPSPCPGGTTSLDALANGVPVLTQAGRDYYARIGPLMLLPCGLPELVAADWDDYVARAHALTADFSALNALRVKTRAGFESSPYRDEVGFTRKLETAYRQMFTRWAAADVAPVAQAA